MLTNQLVTTVAIRERVLTLHQVVEVQRARLVLGPERGVDEHEVLVARCLHLMLEEDLFRHGQTVLKVSAGSLRAHSGRVSSRLTRRCTLELCRRGLEQTCRSRQ
jgi:hypothetical protein